MNNFTKTPALSQETVLEATWTDIPDEVRDEVQKLWAILEYGNDHYYANWPGGEEEWWYDGKATTWGERWPKIDNYLLHNNVKECLIHYWW